jgi:hypothetical protein
MLGQYCNEYNTKSIMTDARNHYQRDIGSIKLNKKFWEEANAFFPLIGHGLYRKQRVQKILLLLSAYSFLR